ncbi:MAG: YcgN family cysteine cluster protein [Geminicoccaceae bacterium]|nr:YcgN family cysteine cluster protein [Geminicoccaceae bacterium]
MSGGFWTYKRLEEMTPDEWEEVCDGCGKCCLVKLEDEEDGTIYYTDVHCRLLDCTTCRCSDYPDRRRRVPGCIVLSAEARDVLAMMPHSCAYRRLAEGRGLPDWHHLVCGDRERVHRLGRSVAGRAITESEVDERDLEDRVVDWPLSDD